MKVISISTATQELTLVADNIAYLQKDGNSYTAVLVDGTSIALTEAQYNEIKTYLVGE